MTKHGMFKTKIYASPEKGTKHIIMTKHCMFKTKIYARPENFAPLL